MKNGIILSLIQSIGCCRLVPEIFSYCIILVAVLLIFYSSMSDICIEIIWQPWEHSASFLPLPRDHDSRVLLSTQKLEDTINSRMVNEGSSCSCKGPANRGGGAPDPVGPLLHGRDSLWIFLLSIQRSLGINNKTKLCSSPWKAEKQNFFF